MFHRILRCLEILHNGHLIGFRMELIKSIVFTMITVVATVNMEQTTASSRNRRRNGLQNLNRRLWPNLQIDKSLSASVARLRFSSSIGSTLSRA